MSYLTFGNWSSQVPSVVQTQIPLRAQIQWSRILDKPTDIQFFRNGAFLDPQTVRVEYLSGVSDASSPAGDSSLRRVVVFGIHGHPDLDDTDVQTWDVFTMDEVEFTVIAVDRTLLGQIQAHAEAVG